MKKLVILLFTVLSLTLNVKAQTKFAFAYAYSTQEKTLYISYPINTANYTDCTDNNGYNSKIRPEKCIEREFIKSVKIEAGSNHSSYNFAVRSCKYDNYGYDCNDPFTSDSQAAGAIRDVIAKYRENGYAVVRLNL